MIKIVAILACVAAVLAAPQGPSQAPPSPASDQKPAVEVLQQDSFVGQDGYNFQFRNSDGTSRQETGELIHVGNATGISVNGSYSYVAPDGQHFSVTFTADDKGYNPEVHIAPSDQPQQQ